MKLQICTACGVQNNGKRKHRGSFLGEIGLWLLGLIFAMFTFGLALLVPLVYSIWRFVAGSERVCTACGHASLVPLDSPIGRKIHHDTGPVVK